jgi:hypothetical protein
MIGLARPKEDKENTNKTRLASLAIVFFKSLAVPSSEAHGCTEAVRLNKTISNYYYLADRRARNGVPKRDTFKSLTSSR